MFCLQVWLCTIPRSMVFSVAREDTGSPELPLELGLRMMVQSQHVGLELRSSRRVTSASATDPPLQSLVCLRQGHHTESSSSLSAKWDYRCILSPLPTVMSLSLCFLFSETPVVQSTTERTLMPRMSPEFPILLPLPPKNWCKPQCACLGELCKILTGLLQCEQKSLQCCVPGPCLHAEPF